MTDKNKIASDLQQLVIDFSYPERRNAEMLEEIDKLLNFAINALIRIGLGVEEVENILGPPYAAIGERSSEEFQWLYPGLSPDGTEEPHWFWCFKFHDQALLHIAKEKWGIFS